MKTATHIIILAAILIASAVYCHHFFGGYEGLGDGNDYAALARNLSSGKGFSVGHIYPLSLVFNDKIPQPNNLWAPGYPLYLASWFSIFGANDQTALFASVFALWLLIISGYLLGRKTGGDTIGLTAAGLIGLGQIVLYAAIEGTPEILAGAILTFSALILLGRQRPLEIIISGILFGIAVLTRYQIAIISVPLTLLFIENKKKNLSLWIMACFLAISPWLIRNWVFLGNPFFTLQSYGEFTKGMGRFDDFYFTYRSFTPMSLWYAATNFPFDLAKKFVAGLIFFGGAFPLRFNFIGIIPFFFGLFVIGKMGGLQRKLVFFSFLASVLIIVFSALDGHHDRHLVPLQPFLVAATLLGSVVLAREFGFYKYKLITIVMGALLFLPVRYPFQELTLSAISNRCRAAIPAYEEISRIAGADEVIASDASDALWWYADRMSIWIPVHYNDYKIIADREDCHYLYLSKPSDFIQKLSPADLADFASSAELIQEFEGPGNLYKLIKQGS